MNNNFKSSIKHVRHSSVKYEASKGEEVSQKLTARFDESYNAGGMTMDVSG